VVEGRDREDMGMQGVQETFGDRVNMSVWSDKYDSHVKNRRRRTKGEELEDERTG
jgi:hypothetical protein